MLRSLLDPGAESDRRLVDRLVSKPLRLSALQRALHELRLSTPAGRSQPASPALGAQSDVRGVRLLLADDNAVNRKVASRMLEHVGVEVACVTSGREALEALQDGHFDVVLMDCQMPVMDGYEATRLLRQSDGIYGDPHIPVIALTAHVMDRDRDKCRAAGMDDYVSKPVDAGLLQDAIARAVGRTGGAAVPELVKTVAGIPKTAAGGRTVEATRDDGAGHELFDEPALLLRIGGDLEFAHELVATFEEAATDVLRQMDAASASTDAEALRKLAHTLKGSAANISAGAIAHAALRLEDVCAMNLASKDAYADVIEAVGRTVELWQQRGWLGTRVAPRAQSGV
jgi:CheY-like chemotaxis protein/HPt (histidine-containing phosphotransfer) domain-containing protein